MRRKSISHGESAASPTPDPRHKISVLRGPAPAKSWRKRRGKRRVPTQSEGACAAPAAVEVSTRHLARWRSVRTPLLSSETAMLPVSDCLLLPPDSQQSKQKVSPTVFSQMSALHAAHCSTIMWPDNSFQGAEFSRAPLFVSGDFTP